MGTGPTAFGELVACSRRRAAFSEDDLSFVESIGNVLMATVERERANDETQREQALATRREEQLNDAQRLAQMGSWDTDFASRTQVLSENMRELLALDSCATTEEVFLARVHEDDRERMRVVMRTPSDDDTTAEFRVRLPDGSVRVFVSVFHAIRDHAGVATGLRSTVKDETEARAAVVALRRSEERFRQGFDNAPIAMSLVDPREHALFACQRRVLHDGRAGAGGALRADLRGDQPHRGPAGDVGEPAAAGERRARAVRDREALPCDPTAGRSGRR